MMESFRDGKGETGAFAWVTSDQKRVEGGLGGKCDLESSKLCKKLWGPILDGKSSQENRED